MSAVHRYQRHAATAPSATQLENLLTRGAEVVPTNCDCARARAKLTIYQPLAVERLSYKQRPVIRHRINPTIECTLESARVLAIGPTRPPNHSAPYDTQPPDSQFHVIYDIATTLKLRRRHFV